MCKNSAMTIRHRIGVLALPGVIPLDLGAPTQVFWAATDATGHRYYDVATCTPDGRPVRTSAGMAAGLDLCLHVVRRDHGSDVANRTARRCVVPPWRDGGQSQFIERPVPAQGDATTGPTRAWALERLHQPVDLADLAGHAR